MQIAAKGDKRVDLKAFRRMHRTCPTRFTVPEELIWIIQTHGNQG